MNRTTLFLVFTLLYLVSCQTTDKKPDTQNEESPASVKAWESNPSSAPTMFEQGLISTGNEFAISFTPDGKEAYFTRTDSSGALGIYWAEFDGNNWTNPQIASFSGQYDDADPFVTYDGKRLFFMSFRPRTPQDTAMENPDIWYVERTNESWGSPINVEAVNTDYSEGYPSVALNGNLYFPTSREGGDNDIYYSEYKNGQYGPPIRLNAMINLDQTDSNPGISPDESMLFFYSLREGGLGSVDLYVTKKVNGDWAAPQHLGNHINSDDAEFCPYMTPDMKYLFFSRGIRSDSTRKNNIFRIPMDQALKGVQ